MKAILTGSLLDEVEFHARLGLDPEELRAVIDSWPHCDEADDDSIGTLAINNCLNEMCHGLRFSDGEWERLVRLPRSEVSRVYRAWTLSRGASHTGIR